MEHYFSENQKSEFKIKKIRQKIRNFDFEFYTSGGVFSKNRIDAGTLILAENMRIGKMDNVLDMGCGIGVLGIAAAKLLHANVVMSDINKRAIILARKNIKLNNVMAEIHQGDLYEKIENNDFGAVLSNPPQNAGKEVCLELIEQSKNHLKNNGTLQLVARPNKGGKTLANKMKEVFGNVDIIARKSGYAVYLSKKVAS